MELGTLIKKMKSTNSTSRKNAMEVLNKYGDLRAVNSLTKILKNKNSKIRKDAVRILIELQDVRAIEPLIKELGIEDLEVSKAAVKELKQCPIYFKNIQAIENVLPIGSISFRVQDMYGIMSWDPDDDHPYDEMSADEAFSFTDFNTTIDALSDIDDVQVVRILMRLFSDIELYDQDGSLWTISSWSDQRFYDPVKEAWKPVLEAATEVLKNITDGRAIRLFEEFKNEENLSKVATVILKKAKFVETPISQFYEKIILISLPYLQKGKRIEWGVPAIAPLIEALEDEKLHAIEALVELTKELLQTKEKDNILKFLESDKPEIIRMGAELLKGATEK